MRGRCSVSSCITCCECVLAVYVILLTARVIFERVQALSQSPKLREYGSLRLPGDVYANTCHVRENFATSAFAGFPLGHARLFSIVGEAFIACWRGRCCENGRMCTRWNNDMAVQWQRQLSTERNALLANSPDGTDAPVNLVISIAWLRE